MTLSVISNFLTSYLAETKGYLSVIDRCGTKKNLASFYSENIQLIESTRAAFVAHPVIFAFAFVSRFAREPL